MFKWDLVTLLFKNTFRPLGVELAAVSDTPCCHPPLADPEPAAPCFSLSQEGSAPGFWQVSPFTLYPSGTYKSLTLANPAAEGARGPSVILSPRAVHLTHSMYHKLEHFNNACSHTLTFLLSALWNINSVRAATMSVLVTVRVLGAQWSPNKWICSKYEQ